MKEILRINSMNDIKYLREQYKDMAYNHLLNLLEDLYKRYKFGEKSNKKVTGFSAKR